MRLRSLGRLNTCTYLGVGFADPFTVRIDRPVEVKAEHAEAKVKAEKPVTLRRQASQSPDADSLDFAIAEAEKGRAAMVSKWKKLANSKGSRLLSVSRLADRTRFGRFGRPLGSRLAGGPRTD